MMEDLERDVAAFFDAHPLVKPATLTRAKTHSKKMLRYHTHNGRPIAFERENDEFRNVWVLTDSVNPLNLSGIDKDDYAGTRRGQAHTALFVSGFFDRLDEVTRFKVTSLNEVKRILSEVLS